MSDTSQDVDPTNGKPYQAPPRWSAATKRVVTSGILILAALVLYRFRVVIGPLTIAFLLAIVVHPIVTFISRRGHISRGLATGVVFIVLILVMLGSLAAPVTAVGALQRAVRSLQFDLTALIDEIGDFLARPVEILGYSLDLSAVYQDVENTLAEYIRRVAQGTLDVAVNLASGVFWVVFILVVAFYLVRDVERIVHAMDRMAPPGYRDDVARLRKEIGQVWQAFLRGQLLLALAIAIVTTIVDLALGLPYAFVLGLLAGVLEFLPNIGPVLAAIPAVLLALFGGSSVLPLTNFWVAVVVAGAYVLIQQVENNYLVPRIMGSTLELHPALVLIAVAVGGILAGILGILFAVPMLGTLRVIGTYIIRRLYDQDPFAESVMLRLERKRAARPGIYTRVRGLAKTGWAWIRGRASSRRAVGDSQSIAQTDSLGGDEEQHED